MPFYEYQCDACGKDFVLLQSMTAKAEDTACPYCKEKKARKLVSKFSSAAAGQSAASAAIPGEAAEARKQSAGCGSKIHVQA